MVGDCAEIGFGRSRGLDAPVRAYWRQTEKRGFLMIERCRGDRDRVETTRLGGGASLVR
jgi:hypothetical protein